MMQNNIKIAITGGIGCGKSTVSKIIDEEGYTVYSCDKIYSDLLKSGNFINAIASEFGCEVLSDGSLDRRKLSEIVFGDETALKKLNTITHPEIMREALKLMSNHKLSFCEVPLLFENGFEALFDGVIVVLRDKDIRIKSITERDKIAENEVILRINSQYKYDNDDFAKYYVIHNDGNLDDLRHKVGDVLQKIVKKI